jgi:hypothetical protein
MARVEEVSSLMPLEPAAMVVSCSVAAEVAVSWMPWTVAMRSLAVRSRRAPPVKLAAMPPSPEGAVAVRVMSVPVKVHGPGVVL